jgi:hypothetical protein
VGRVVVHEVCEGVQEVWGEGCGVGVGFLLSCSSSIPFLLRPEQGTIKHWVCWGKKDFQQIQESDGRLRPLVFGFLSFSFFSFFLVCLIFWFVVVLGVFCEGLVIYSKA